MHSSDEQANPRRRALLVLAVAGLPGCAALGGAPAGKALAELAPTGTLRAAIVVGPVGSTFRAVADPATGRPRGVAADLAQALGAQLGLPVVLQAYGNYPDLLEAAAKGGWDVTFLPYDDARAKLLDYGPAYFNQEYTYIVPGSSPIRSVDEADRPGIRIAAAEGSVSARNREAALKNAKVLRFKTVADLREQLRAGSVDAAVAGRETLVGLAGQVPGTRVLADSFLVEGVAVALPKGRAEALRLATGFIEGAKRDGTVRRALDAHGFTDAQVAPPQR